MNFINTPLEIIQSESILTINRNLEDKVAMIDNLIELIVFTPKGSFSADPDFGFEYWNHEYSNVHHKDFNNGHIRENWIGLYNDITKRECQESIKKSIEIYEPQLTQIEVSIELNTISHEKRFRHRKVFPKYEILIRVNGILNNDLGVTLPYEKRILFYMEPTVKQINI